MLKDVLAVGALEKAVKIEAQVAEEVSPRAALTKEVLIPTILSITLTISTGSLRE